MSHFNVKPDQVTRVVKVRRWIVARDIACPQEAAPLDPRQAGRAAGFLHFFGNGISIHDMWLRVFNQVKAGE